MSEAVEGDAGGREEAGGSAGAMLRQAREAAGLHVSTLAANLKVPVRKLEALEEDRYDQLGDVVFVRALASSVCRTLKMDPRPVLQRLPQTAQPRLVQDREGINAPFRAPGDGPKPGWRDQVSRPVLATVVALLLAAAVVVFLPALQRGYETVAAAAAAASASGPDPVMPPPGAAATVPTGPAPMETTGSAPLAMSSVMAPDAGAPGPAPAPAAAAAAPAAAATPPAAPLDAVTTDASGIIVFRARAPSWVQVTDARGATVLRRLMVDGETAGATGTLPLTVTVGSAGSTEVQVRGKPFNLAPVSRDNVARFEVK